MQDKKFAPFYLALTLAIEIAFVLLILEIEQRLVPSPHHSSQVMVTPEIWNIFLVLTLVLAPLITLTMSRKSSPILTEIRSRSTSRGHLALYRFPVGLFLGMGFCMPALVGEPLGEPLSYTVSIALLPVGIVFLIYVGLGKFATPLLDRLHRWTFHWTGKLVIAFGVLLYLVLTVSVMYALRTLDYHWPYILAAFAMAYLPLRVYLLYWGRGSYLGLALISAGMVFQQIMLWT